jgi:hypothetical protein
MVFVGSSGFCRTIWFNKLIRIHSQFFENHGTIIITCHYGSIIINTQKGMFKQFLNEKNSSGVLEN